MPIKLLVADDSVTIQKVVKLAFAGEQVEIEAVGSGDAALEAARQSKPDIILADVFMPGANGYQVCERIRKDPALQSIPVVLLAGSFEAFDEAEAARVGSSAHLRKPFDGSELANIVHKLVPGHSRTARESVGILPQISRFLSDAAPLISDKTRQSLIGGESILNLLEGKGGLGPGPWGESPSQLAASRLPWLEEFGLPAPSAAPPKALEGEIPHTVSVISPIPSPSIEPAVLAGPIPEEWADAIVEKLVRRISQDAVREIAWEVVPELAEILIRQRLEEHSKGSND